MKQSRQIVYLQTIDEMDLEVPTNLPSGAPIAKITEVSTPLKDSYSEKMKRQGKSWFVEGEWLIENNQLVGVRIMTKSVSEDMPNAAVCMRCIFFTDIDFPTPISIY